jgi:adenylate cyclase
MNIYSDYISTIKSAINADKKGIHVNEQRYNNFEGDIKKSFSYKDYKESVSDSKLMPSLENFARDMGLNPNFNQKPGLHPDFAYLKDSNSIEKHYIVSMFIDIKGSTNLFKKYLPETVLVITNTLQRAAIHTCLVFGGYIHRLQGDGLFVYFGGKSISEEKATIMALQCASVFTYFVKNDLKNLFLEQGIERINTRIGIDFGFKDDVIWAKAGIGEISEVTTCSLHTSLASKMQAKAEANGIVIGDKVKAKDKLIAEHSQPVCIRTKDENDRYIFQIPEENFRYTQYDFDWLGYLKKLPFIRTDLNGNLIFQNRINLSERKPENLMPIAIQNKPYIF